MSDFYDKGAAGPSVGPSTYGQERWGDTLLEAQGGALELQSRPSICHWHTKANPPGPGVYSLRRTTSDPAVVRPGKTNPIGSGASPFRSRTGRISKDDFKEPLLVPGSRGYLPCSVKDNPGPGAYDTQGDLAELVSDATGCHSRIPKVYSETPASFPPLREADKMTHTGITELEETWHRSNKDTVSPGDYTLQNHSAMHTVLQRVGASPDFHASCSQRKLYPPECHIENNHPWHDNPAPGAYNLRKRLVKGTCQPFASETPQMATAQPFVTSSEQPALDPGPGAYSPASAMNSVTREEQRNCKGVHCTKEKMSFPGMRTKKGREGLFRPAIDQPYSEPDVYSGFIPSPDHYPKEQSCMKGYTKATHSVRMSTQGTLQSFHGVHQPHQLVALRKLNAGMTKSAGGFSSTESRYCMVPKQHSKDADPGTYDRHLSIGQSVQANVRDLGKLGKSGAFGGSREGNRFYRYRLDGTKGTPAPHDYKDAMPQHMTMAVSGIEASGGAFRSGVPQLAPDLAVDQHVKPGPGEYEAPSMVSKEPDRFSPRQSSAGAGTGVAEFQPALSPKSKASSFRKPRTDHLSFGAGSSRATIAHLGGKPKPSEVVLSRNHSFCAIASPGPGEYDPAATRRRGSGGAAKVTTDRQLEPPWERSQLLATTSLKEPLVGPGPGSYDISGSLHQRTHNTSGERAATWLMQSAANIAEKASSKQLAIEQKAAGGGAGGGLAGTRARLSDQSQKQLPEGKQAQVRFLPEEGQQEQQEEQQEDGKQEEEPQPPQEEGQPEQQEQQAQQEEDGKQEGEPEGQLADQEQQQQEEQQEPQQQEEPLQQQAEELEEAEQQTEAEQ